MNKTEPRKRVRRKEARPQEIIAAAMHAFAEKGFAGAKIEEIAERAGVAKGTVYLYFPTKDAIFEAAVRERLVPFFNQLGGMMETLPLPAGQMIAGMLQKAYAELINFPERRVIMQIMLAEGARFPHLAKFYHDTIIANAKKMLQRIIKHGIDTGEFRPTALLDQPDVIMAPALMAVVWKITFEQIDPIDLEQFAKNHIDLVLNSLLAKRPGEQ